MITFKNVHIQIKKIMLTVRLLMCSTSVIVDQSESNDFKKIKKIFYQQENDWNTGDINAFM